MNLFGETAAIEVEPLAPYLGGKRQLAKRIVGRINQIQHDTYVDVFCGMGGVFWRRTVQAKGEVINDINRDLILLYRVLRSHREEFLRSLEFFPSSRAEFEALKGAGLDHLTDIQRAVRFYYLQKLALGGKSSGQSFGVSIERPSRFNLAQAERNLRRASTRLAGVTIECIDWRDCIERYDKESTLFYLDPPYYGGENDYGKGVFKRTDYEEMALRLARIKGRFLLSLNDVGPIREVFSAFSVEQLQITYTIAKESGKRVFELLIGNCCGAARIR
ncbi:DNA adenine methylase [Pseudovibrio exalbescens]|uniref:site-specific DNA-methyltransferase (adenine-specific) n=1 Tax=Pseudovibrio exalbescens TaxID=197461 RepID=A0A1U7JF15_9HYPH|nr:DNA adenine methylase [Pseudovibrio exalbescens]OKL43295.1 hypothetical protein A3843_14360 [Pseudovibrio exalbescens]